MKQYYLAHQLKFRHEIRKIQKDLEYYYGISLINPFYDTERNDIKRIDNGTLQNTEMTVQEKETVVFFDLAMIDNCDGVVCILLDHDVIGSFMEIFYAWHDLDIPVYVICLVDKIRLHPWVVTCAFKLFKSIDEFKEYLKINGKDMQ